MRRARGTVLWTAACLMAGCGEGRPAAVSYPARPIKVVVPFGPGGGTDAFARVMEQAIREHGLLPQPLAVINVGGAGATIGSRRVKNARPDGYTVLILHEAIITAKYAGQAGYGPEAFEPVAATGRVGMVIAVDEDSPFDDLQGLMAAARTKSGKAPAVSFGANIGALTHFAGLALEQATEKDARFRFVQLGGGAGRFAALKGGHIDVTGFSIEEFTRFRPEGLRGLAVLSEDRHSAAPDVPTAREQGFDVAADNVFYWWMPRGTPRERIEVFADALQRAMQTDDVRRRLAAMHIEPLFLRGEALKERVAASTGRIAGVVTRPTADLPDFPLAVALAVILVTVVVVLQERWWRRTSADLSTSSGDERSPAPRSRRAAACGLLMLLYVSAMAAGLADFRTATLLFVPAVGAVLAMRRPRRLPALILLGAALAFGLHYLFTRVFVIDLP